MAPTDHDLYDPILVAGLFDRMAASYERVNELTSFGFSRRWRRQAVGWLDPRPGDTVLDAMTGMGEGWRYLSPRIGPGGRIIAIDLSSGMLHQAKRRRERPGSPSLDLRLGDALATGLPDASVDRMRAAGLETELRSVMFGCATGVAGHRRA